MYFEYHCGPRARAKACSSSSKKKLSRLDLLSRRRGISVQRDLKLPEKHFLFFFPFMAEIKQTGEESEIVSNFSNLRKFKAR